MEKNPDFIVGITNEVYESYEQYEETTAIFGRSLISDEIIHEIMVRGNLKEEELRFRRGFFPIPNNGSQKVPYSLLSKNEVYFESIQMIREDEMELLVDYVKQNNFQVDFDAFINSKGVIILHNHALLNWTEGNVQNTIGENLSFYDMVPIGTYLLDKNKIELINCGYLDYSNKFFPDLDLHIADRNSLIFLISEKTYADCTDIMTGQLLNISFDVSSEEEAFIKNDLVNLVDQENQSFQRSNNMDEVDFLYMVSNSDVIAGRRGYIEGSRAIMFMVTAIFIIVGAINYFNAILSDIIAIKREFAIMGCLGMTRKQLRHMIMMEGVSLFLIVLTLLSFAGSGLLILLGGYMESRVAWFEFHYPFKITLIIAVLLFGICIVVPQIIYDRDIKTSPVERLRRSV